MTPLTVRAAARARETLGGADAEALEHALTITERERNEARESLCSCRAQLEAARIDRQRMLSLLGQIARNCDCDRNAHQHGTWCYVCAAAAVYEELSR